MDTRQQDCTTSAVAPRTFVGSPPLRHNSTSSDEYDEYLHDRESSSSLEDEDDCETVQVVFNRIYVDPLQDVMERIDAEAGNVLRTGRLTVQGEAGDMDILQPILFSLQPTDAELPVLLPQLMQSPFFHQKEDNSMGTMVCSQADALLSNGNIRLGLVVDQIIYNLLSSFCCKGPGARQADALIETALKTTYSLPSGILRFQEACQNPPPLLPSGYTTIKAPEKDEAEFQENGSEEEEMSNSVFLDVQEKPQRTSRSTSGVSSTSSLNKECSFEDNLSKSFETIPPHLFARNRTGSLQAGKRKDSVFDAPNLADLSRKISGPDVFSSTSSTSSLLQQSNTWHVSLPYPKDVVLGAFGDNTFPILMWNPDLQVKFQIGTQYSNMTTSVVEVDNSTKSIVLKVVNTTDHKIAFSIRSHRQSMMYRSHVIYPKEGLHLLEPQQEWITEAEILHSSKAKQGAEYICIDLFVGILNSHPSWNLSRRYAVLKQNQEENKVLKKLSRGCVPLKPGSLSTQQKDLKSLLKQVVVHGLQSVVKNKLDEAEIIFTQAMHLPLFQRVPLKAFVYICLAVVANKRRKKENLTKVNHALKLVNSMNKLVEASESSPTMTMPKMIALVKQLEKELNPRKLIQESRTTVVRKPIRSEVTTEVDAKGKTIDLYNTSLVIPDEALSQTVKLTLSNMTQEEIHQVIQSSPWSSMLSVIGAIYIVCSPPVERFNKPVEVTIMLSDNVTAPTSTLHLLQSNYMNSWIDRTNDSSTEITMKPDRIILRTDYTGWLLVATLKYDLTKIMELAVTSAFTEEPVLLDINVFGHIFAEQTSGQISVFISPHNDSQQSNTVEGPPGHQQISFPHSLKASKGQKIRVELQGQFEPDKETGQKELWSEFKVDNSISEIIEKTVRLSSNAKGINGKLVLKTYCASHNNWEKLQEINLTSASSYQQNGF